MKTVKPRKHPDQHGNVIALEGCTRCYCGCKYWENDLCIDCKTPAREIIENGEDE